MTISKKQRKANRHNCKKSTGPVTDQGKTTVSQNAVKHGFYAKNIIIDSPALKENQSEYDLLYDSLVDELKPNSLFQEYLVRKIANCLWRSRRAVIAETARINRTLERIDPDPELANARSIPDSEISLNILRYEMRLDRQITRALRLLRHLQRHPNSKPDNIINMGPPNMAKQSHFGVNQ